MVHVDDEVFVIERVSSMVPAAPDDPEAAMASCDARQAAVAAVVEVVVDGEVVVAPLVDEVVAVVEVVAAPVVGGDAAGPPQAASHAPAARATTATPARWRRCHFGRAGCELTALPEVGAPAGDAGPWRSRVT
jgi:hypothetical protein